MATTIKITPNRIRMSVILFVFIAIPSAYSAPSKNVISKSKATQIAHRAQKGKIEEGELEFEKKRWIYSFDIRGKDKMIHEVHVDAFTGRILSKSIETASMEANEK